MTMQATIRRLYTRLLSRNKPTTTHTECANPVLRGATLYGSSVRIPTEEEGNKLLAAAITKGLAEMERQAKRDARDREREARNEMVP